MNDLFEIPESKSPERQWIDLAKMFGIRCIEDDGKHSADLCGIRAHGHPTEFEAINAYCLAAGGFPTFDEWKLRQSKAQK